MQRTSRKVFQGVFAGMVAGVLGFGTSQVFASPAAAGTAVCTREDAAECSASCYEALGPGWRGRCTVNSVGQKSCQCVQIILPG